MHNTSAKLVLITTEYPPEKYCAQLKVIEVEIKLVPFVHKPPEGYAKKFLGCFYLLDAIISQGEVDTLYLDPDIVCIKPLGDLGLSHPTICGYPLEFRSEEDINGITYDESIRIARDFFKKPENEFTSYTFFGGEFYFIPKDFHFRLVELIEGLYKFSVNRFFNGESFFPTEEHLLSAALKEFNVIKGNVLIKRIWTARKFRNIDGTEKSLSLLHFPAEKEFGFKKAYRRLTSSKGSKNLSNSELFEAYIFKVFQINRRARMRMTELALRKIIAQYRILME
jgi:hypothetical protein